MENTSEQKTEVTDQMETNNVSLALLAHVDAGKTTLAESILYHTGSIRKMGRVDHKDAFLDTDSMGRGQEVLRFFPSRQVFPWEKRTLLFWIRRDMWIFLRKWKEHCRFWITQCFSSAVQMGGAGLSRLLGLVNLSNT